MPLTLLAGPANAGKVARLLQGYLDSLDREPVLIVPNRSDVDSVERELLRTQPALLGGSIGTFEDVFERLARGVEEGPLPSPPPPALVAPPAIPRAPPNGRGPSARFAGFADALLQAVAELEAGLLDPADLPGDLGVLYGAYRTELDRLGLADRGLVRAAALDRLESDFEAWHGEPVFAYGFE